jgi:acetolactate synthase-1/2/3 large subunit
MNATSSAKYGDLLVEWLQELGYTHCFFVAGGNNMHLLNAVRNRLECVPFVHEVSAGIAAEYFNEAGGDGRAFVLVTAGPGLTQLVSALAGAFLESRELLVIGGQVKRSDLIADSGLRQRGIQEIDGIAIASPVCKRAERMETPQPRSWLVERIEAGRSGRPGPVFLEVCLDVQGAPVDRVALEDTPARVQAAPLPEPSAEELDTLLRWLGEAERPLLLLGGGLGRETVAELLPRLRELGIPFQTTWNGMDRVGAEEPLYFGRPNTWGQRYANVILQQADLVVALGSRLGLQQTGFNWQGFAPVGRVAQVEIDPAELEKGHPRVDLPLRADANAVLRAIAGAQGIERREGWIGFCERVRELLPLDEREINETRDGFLSPFAFCLELSGKCTADDVVIPCSSGGANFVMMQSFQQRPGQVVITDKGLASMGYGLGGAIGAALAHRDRRTVLVEGDGGFTQNLQELATVAVNDLNVKIFIFSNEGYASIRMTQRNYFGGDYVGCDTKTGLGFPDWDLLFRAYGIPVHELGPDGLEDPGFASLFDAPGPAAFVVPVDPEQTYLPKISSRVTATGSMESNPLHHMSPPLPDDVAREVFAFVPAGPDA